MPKFLYTVILAIVVLWGVIYKLVTSYSPDSTLLILFFLTILFIALAFSLSLPVYAILLRKAPRFTSFRDIYRKAIRLSLFVSFGIVLILILRWLNLINPITFVLFIAFYIITFLQVKKNF